MHKTMNRDNNPMQGHVAKAKFFRAFARGIFLLIILLILVGFSAEVWAQGTEPVESKGSILWSMVGIIAFGTAIWWLESKCPCDPRSPWHDDGTQGKDTAGVQPLKPWPRDEPTSQPESLPQPWPSFERAFPDLDLPIVEGTISEETIQQIITPPSDPVPNYTLDSLYPGYKSRAADDPNFVERRKHDRTHTGSESHKDDHAVLLFTFSMKQRLSEKRQQKEDYDHHNTAAISVEDLEKALLVAMRRGNVIDIANHCMFLEARGVRTIKTGVRG